MNSRSKEESGANHATDSSGISFENRLAYDKVTFYYISLPVMLLGHIMGALLLSAIQLEAVDHYPIRIWLLVNCVMFLYMVYHYRLFRKESEENKLKDVNLWLDRYYTNVLISGIVWGSSGFMLFPDTGLLNQMTVVLFLFAIGFTSMGVLASKHDLLLTYVLVTFTPLVMRLFFMEDGLYNTIAFAMLALILIMILVANYYGGVINSALSNHLHFITMKQSHEKLKERFFSLFDRAPVGIYYYNRELKIQDANAQYVQMVKVREREELIGTSLSHGDNSHVRDAHAEVFTGKNGNYRGPLEILDGGESLYINLSTVPMMDNDDMVAGGIAIVNDITSEVTAKEKMLKNAYYDILTDTPNRTLLMDMLRTFISDKEKKRYAALLLLDVNNFKSINNSYGHDIGDNLLKQIAYRIEEITQEHETLARIGGDRFVILVPQLSTELEVSKELASRYIDTINSSFKQPANVAGDEYYVSFSIGTTLFSDTTASAFDLLKQAETAMYEAKRSARGTVRFYEESMGENIHEQLILESDLRKAIGSGELDMYYQPQLEVDTNRIVSAEALVRWRHPERGLITPELFLPIAEESGTIVPLGEWVFDRVLHDIKSLEESRKNSNLNHIAINVSMVHFSQPNFVEKLMQLVTKHKVEPQRIVLEIQEGGLMHNVDNAAQKINELKSFGFTFSIDNFGTGHFSLSCLHKLPVDIIKIDRLFICNIGQNRGEAIIVESLIDIAEKLQLKVIAEGVEMRDTLDYLKRIKCTMYQGNYAHKPMTINELKRLIWTS